jgi:putative oxidoreductase
MKIATIIRPALAIAGGTRRIAEPGIALVTRLVIGYAFYVAGTGKIAHFDSTVDFFASLGLPAPTLNAGFISGLEVVGGIALMCGLATRVFALLLSSTMVVALATAHAADIASALTVGGKGSLTDIVAFVYLLFLGWLVVHGAGAVSLDRALGGRALRVLTGDSDIASEGPAHATGGGRTEAAYRSVAQH